MKNYCNWKMLWLIPVIVLGYWIGGMDEPATDTSECEDVAEDTCPRIEIRFKRGTIFTSDGKIAEPIELVARAINDTTKDIVDGYIISWCHFRYEPADTIPPYRVDSDGNDEMMVLNTYIAGYAYEDSCGNTFWWDRDGKKHYSKAVKPTNHTDTPEPICPFCGKKGRSDINDYYERCEKCSKFYKVDYRVVFTTERIE
ncbi:MAG TPA: hypothetical protein ENH82_19585 [bacterium]|nr:hypothetical protein [bacterium]